MVLGNFLAELQSRLVLVCEDCPLTSTRSGNLRPTKGLIHRYHSIVFYRVVSDVGPYQMLLRSQAE